ncbi:MAG: 4-hydroxy-3-methylbut-2-enyl diphosphate reductase [Bacteroidetes bacterium]|jgi:4-hydroxy-3-methylbut-2-enyl diphosphate reductase|nr:4-hydroxy-3-methylbut-2-enyl diphosphate reductase [Bacteroidota bacterium]
MKSFNIPDFYKSPVISKVKEIRKISDPRKKDFSPTILDFGPVRFFIARHFGFCYGVEHAIETAYKAIEENSEKRIFLLSQMIHNPEVNNDLLKRGVRFLMDTSGKTIIPFTALTPNDIVIIPAFGTTLKIEEELDRMGIEVRKYDTTCPFVERVWKKSEKLGEDSYSIIIHGKANHEETKATFSRSEKSAPSIIVKDIKEARIVGNFILGKVSVEEFKDIFKGNYSENFDPEKDLIRVGVINQTTMLAVETQEIAEYFKEIMLMKYSADKLKEHFADTRDTLCYATNENQEATYGLLKENADLAIVVGGYNSSNTSHIVELCEEKLPTYFISSVDEIKSKSSIYHFDYRNHEHIHTDNFIPEKPQVDIILTSGASCPDSVVEAVLQKILSFFPSVRNMDEVIKELAAKSPSVH